MSSPTPDWMDQCLQTPLLKEKRDPHHILYLESWLSPAAFQRDWHIDERIPPRFTVDIDMDFHHEG